EGIAFQSASAQYQTFLTRCRRERLIGPMPDMRAFRRRFAVAGAGLAELDEALQARIMQLAGAVEEDLLGPFLVIAKAAHAGETQVDEAALARAYGTSSPGRIRRLLDHLERQGLVVVREDFGGDRTIMVPGLEPLADG
ncbi:MAG TPA: ATP-binding protein, partial [Erythrobacter sp.]|nr:ATP-binding protein [Erythrobacter sp.]